MTLPRFISGKLGPATAADMNRVMAATEQVEGLRSIGRGGETFQTLSENDRKLTHAQSNAMAAYAAILEVRIARADAST